jgi:hypothetical protein
MKIATPALLHFKLREEVQRLRVQANQPAKIAKR